MAPTKRSRTDQPLDFEGPSLWDKRFHTDEVIEQHLSKEIDEAKYEEMGMCFAGRMIEAIGQVVLLHPEIDLSEVGVFKEIRNGKLWSHPLSQAVDEPAGKNNASEA